MESAQTVVQRVGSSGVDEDAKAVFAGVERS